MSSHLEPADVERFIAAAEARPDDLMDSASAAFKAMATAASQGDRDGVAAAAIVVGDTCLQVCVSSAEALWQAEDKVRFLRIMIGWAWTRHPALGAVLEAACRAESATWGI